MIDRDLFVSRNLTDVSPYFLHYAHHDSIKIPSFALWSKYLGAKVFLFAFVPLQIFLANFLSSIRKFFRTSIETNIRTAKVSRCSRNHCAIWITSRVTDTPSSFEIKFEIKHVIWILFKIFIKLVASIGFAITSLKFRSIFDCLRNISPGIIVFPLKTRVNVSSF